MGGEFMLEERICAVKARIGRACRKAGRAESDVRLIAVSKTMPWQVVAEAQRLGLDCFGENRVQEAREKIEHIGSGPEWHLIGTLQSNKAKYAVRLFNLIHSVDSFDLCEAISAEAAKQGRLARVLFEVNVSGESTKHGFDPTELPQAARRALGLPGIQLEGLMTMAPFCDDPEGARPVFRGLKRLFDEIAASRPENGNWRTLSMGMTNDFEVAIEEGATMVRVGRAIFGDRS